MSRSDVLAEIRQQRIAKVHQLRDMGLDPYPPDAVPRIPVAEARALPDGGPASIAGRIMLLRPMGNLTFGQLHDETGDMQFMISRRDLPEDHQPGYKALVKLLDIGDFVAIEGHRLQTKTGELSVGARKITPHQVAAAAAGQALRADQRGSPAPQAVPGHPAAPGHPGDDLRQGQVLAVDAALPRRS